MSNLSQTSVLEDFKVDQQLLDKCIFLFESPAISYLLHRNGEIIWIILVPHTTAQEFYQLPPAQLHFLSEEINRLSSAIEQRFGGYPATVTTIGDNVEQMHVHIIYRQDAEIFLPEKMWEESIETEHSEIIIRQLRKIIEDRDY